MIARKAVSDLAGDTVAPGLRPSNPVSDGRKVEKEAIEKEHRDPQAHFAGSIHAGEYPAAPFIDDYDLPRREPLPLGRCPSRS